MARLPKQRTNEPTQPCIESLRLARPDVAITVSRSHDSYFSWNGDGPDPRDEGFDPYNVDVVASTIHNGVLIEGRSSLGGSYFREDEPIGEIHGYLPQMVEEAVEELDREVSRA